MTLLKKLLKQKSLSKRKPKILELILYTDLVVNHKGRSVAEEIGISKENKVYKHAPGECPKCKCKKLISLQILGAINKELMWMCDSCETLFLKYSYRYTITKLNKSKEYWTNPNDWFEPDIGEYN